MHYNIGTIHPLLLELTLSELKNHLRRLRFLHKEMTQQELADRVGVTRQTILAIEKGRFNPSTKLALRIAQVFGVSVEEIFYLEGEQ
jgi:putative transcriptional regulator